MDDLNNHQGPLILNCSAEAIAEKVRSGELALPPEDRRSPFMDDVLGGTVLAVLNKKTAPKVDKD